ncbi:nitrilase and fragile histidine triad fusion protein NitFhit [Trichonephila inaurata madagascariensis]|uniref:Nitrilase and fragile histidine triad fusion protein NitFhit n=1 Tax=Trichonephila inaurata madagascariensis TaxID=2747483 RepID=A0A8X7BRQ5_9ARAC|nr:nitrilase and fragile histidine triad fusion protein NitFhit [Trichonephila inaurata madagascariensis]
MSSESNVCSRRSLELESRRRVFRQLEVHPKVTGNIFELKCYRRLVVYLVNNCKNSRIVRDYFLNFNLSTAMIPVRFLTRRSLAFKYCAFNSPVTSKSRLFSGTHIMSSNKSVTVAVCQLKCTADKKKNFETCKGLIYKAVSHNAKMVFLPECFDFIGESIVQTIELSETLDGPLMSEYKKLAAEQSLWLSLGGFHEKDSVKAPNKVFNAHVLINPSGQITSVYRKVHLFDIDIVGIRVKESDFTIPGPELCSPVDTDVGKVGLGSCYDLRFPEFALALTKAGAEILTYPSAFTLTTGMAHWESLLRSRAIENQCYVIAAAQTGKHNANRTTYGHAMVIDPWGCIIACCSDGVGITFADINLEYMRKVRTAMPVWEHRRSELYGNIIPAKSSPDSNTIYMFADIQLNPGYIFYKTKYSIAFVNKKCVVPGHVLVTPIRIAKRLQDMHQHEVADLFMCVQTVQKKIEEAYSVSSSSIVIQDGPEAGQTVPHLHVHILPRKSGDFKKNDDVYTKLQKHDKPDEKIQWRSPEDMLEEANRLKAYF